MEHVLSLSSIRLRTEVLNNEISKAQRELEDLAAAERMVLRFGSNSDASKAADINLSVPVTSSGNSKKAMNLAGLVQAVMRQSPSPWMTSENIRVKASELKGEEIPSGSIAPTLWTLKNEGVIVREGYKVALASRLNENGAINGLPSTAPKTALAAQ
jgi:hypothetical protein